LNNIGAEKGITLVPNHHKDKRDLLSPFLSKCIELNPLKTVTSPRTQNKSKNTAALTDIH
jgi:hypothetical protein